MMPRDLVYNYCDSIDSNGNGDTRDEAFRDWDQRRVRGGSRWTECKPKEQYRLGPATMKKEIEETKQ